MKIRPSLQSVVVSALSLLSFGFAVNAVAIDPPNRVARISYLGGDVSFAPAGEDSWHSARINRPLVANDRLWVGQGGRIELELGTAFVRMDQGTSFEFLSLDDQLAQIQLTEGTLNLRVDHLYEGQIYEVNTPTLAFVVSEVGDYRLDIGAGGESTQVTVFDGYGEVYGEDSRNVQVQAGVSYRFFDSGLSDYERLAMPRPDDFDQWAFARNERYQNSPTRQYVSEEMIGYADLDDYGSWRPVADHGNVWFPRRVAAGWAPYRHGHWSWVDPWGWSWIDDEPWGFAPSHYGRWVYVANGWGWVPGPRHVRPIYAPALVAFVGGSNWSLSISSGGPPIGWFPLGPRDVYVPWYQVSRGYFGRVNVHNTVIVNNTYVTNIYNDYYVQGRPVRRDYTFRNAANAVTVVPRDNFVSSRNAAQSMARLRPGALAQGELISRAPAAPTRASLADPGGRLAAPTSRGLDRQVVARTQPAARTAPFAVRERAIARNGGEPLAADQMRRLGADAAPAAGSRSGVRMIGRDGASSVRQAATRDTPAAQAPSSAREVVTRGVDAQPAPISGASRNPSRAATTRRDPAAVAPSVRSAAPARGTAAPVGTRAISREASPQQERALPSARYSPQRQTGQGRASSRSDAQGIPLPRQRSTAPAQRSGETGNAPSAVRERTAAPVRESSRAPVQQREAAPALRQRAPAVRQVDPVQRQAAPAQRSLPQRQISEPRSAPAPQQSIPSAPPQARRVAPAREPAPARAEPAPVREEAPAAREAPRERAAPAQRGEERSRARSRERERERERER